MASLCSYNCKLSTVDELFDSLASNQGTCPIIKAKSLAWLACLHGEKGNIDKSRQLHNYARQTFQGLDHAYALAEMGLVEACRDFQGQISELEEPATKVLDVCERIDYPRGAMDALGRVGKVAQALILHELNLGLAIQTETIAKRIGSRVILAQTRLRCVDIWTKLSGHDGKVISAASAVYNDLQDTDCVPIRQQAAQLTAEAYATLKNSREAVVWARKCMTDAENCSAIVRSRAALTFLKCEFLSISGTEDAHRKYTIAKNLVQQEMDNAPRIALSMLYILLITFKSAASLFGVDCSPFLPEIHQKIEAVKSGLPVEVIEQDTPLLLHDQAVRLVLESRTRSDTVKEEEALALLAKAGKLRNQGNNVSAAAGVFGLQGQVYHRMVSKFRTPDGYVEIERVQTLLNSSLRYYSLAVKAFETMKQVTEIAKYKHREAKVLYEAWGLASVSPDLVLQKLLEAQRCSDRVREEISVLRGLNAIANKRRLASEGLVRAGYEIAMHVCTQEMMEEKAWEWTQRAKARSLCDILALGVLVPQALVEQIEESKEARPLFEQESALARQLNEASPAEGISIRIELEELHEKMRKIQPLTALMDLREGTPISISRLQQELARVKGPLRGRGIVLVDWVVRGDDIWMLGVNEVGEPSVELLPIKVSMVNDWTAQHLGSSADSESCIMMDEREAAHPMHMLTSLIQPLARMSKPEDILVLSPTENLHSLPLHALQIACDHGSKPLIERNPVVYTASMTSFVQCCQKALETPRAKDLAKVFLAAYEPFSGYDFELAEQMEVHELMNSLAKGTQGESLCGKELTREVFVKTAERAKMLLFHGHCDLVRDDIISQGLRLSEHGGSNNDGSGKEMRPYGLFFFAPLLSPRLIFQQLVNSAPFRRRFLPSQPSPSAALHSHGVRLNGPSCDARRRAPRPRHGLTLRWCGVCPGDSLACPVADREDIHPEFHGQFRWDRWRWRL